MSEKDEFFEAWRARASLQYAISTKRGSPIDATIEAFKEMMIGEPIEGRLLHFAKGYRWAPATHFRAEGSDSSLALANELIGTDGEEVAVLVMRKEK